MQEMSIDNLPDELLIRIFSYFPVEDRILCLENVCRRWRNVMPYQELRFLNVNEMHRKLCRLGSTCQVEMNRRYQLGNRRSLKIWLEKFIANFVDRCSDVVKRMDLSGFSVDEKVGHTLRDFPGLQELNIKNSYLSSYAASTLPKLCLKMLSIDGCDIDDCVLENLSVERLSLTSRVNYQFLPKFLTSLSVQTLNDIDDLVTICENCPLLTAFHLTHSHCISSAAIVEVLESNYASDQLTKVTLTIHPSFFVNLCAAFPNLVELSLRSIKDRHVPTNVDCVSRLIYLEHFRLQCRLLDETSLVTTILKCRNLKEVYVGAKRAVQSENVENLVENSFLELRKLKLFVDCANTTARIATTVVTKAPQLKVVKLMSPKLKQIFATEHNVSTDCFYVDFNRAIVCGAENLHYLTLPYLEAEESFEFFRHLMQRSTLATLAIYGGNFYFENNDTPKYKIWPDLHRLILGPYFQSLTGLENFLPFLVNLHNLSFHIDAGTSALLNVVGQMKELRVLELRSCGKYFLETLQVELLPFLRSRWDLRANNGYLAPLIVNLFTKNADPAMTVSKKLAAEFNDLSIRFKIFF